MAQIPVVNVLGGPATVGAPNAFVGQYTFTTATATATAAGTENVSIRNNYADPANAGKYLSVTYTLPSASLCAGQIRTLMYEYSSGDLQATGAPTCTVTDGTLSVILKPRTAAGGATVAAATNAIGVTVASNGTTWYVVDYAIQNT